MKLKQGDEVSFLNEKGDGVVSRLINATTAAVLMDDGFEIPYLVNELVLKGRGEELPIRKEEVVIEPVRVQNRRVVSEARKRVPEGIYVAFSPENEKDVINSNFNLWIINNTSSKAFFTYASVAQGLFTTIVSDHINTRESFLIATLKGAEVQQFLQFKVDVLFFEEKTHERMLPLSKIVKIKPKKLYASDAFKSNSILDVKAMLVSISSDEDTRLSDNENTDLSELLFQKKESRNTRVQKSIKHVKNDSLKDMEIDLHIENLVDNHHGMSNFEIMTQQLNHLQRSVDRAISEHYRSVVVIHGVGTGKLKEEVCRVLSEYKKLNYYDASYSKYGFGATEIELY